MFFLFYLFFCRIQIDFSTPQTLTGAGFYQSLNGFQAAAGTAIDIDGEEYQELGIPDGRAAWQSFTFQNQIENIEQVSFVLGSSNGIGGAVLEIMVKNIVFKGYNLKYFLVSFVALQQVLQFPQPKTQQKSMKKHLIQLNQQREIMS